MTEPEPPAGATGPQRSLDSEVGLKTLSQKSNKWVLPTVADTAPNFHVVVLFDGKCEPHRMRARKEREPPRNALQYGNQGEQLFTEE
jgi:hypothetical protein